MTLRKRLDRLEAQRGGTDESADRLETIDRVAAYLERIEDAVLASGDASDKPAASLIERAVRRYMRGEASLDDALCDMLARRWP